MQINQADNKLSFQIHWDAVWYLNILDFTWKQISIISLTTNKRTEQKHRAEGKNTTLVCPLLPIPRGKIMSVSYFAIQCITILHYTSLHIKQYHVLIWITIENSLKTNTLMS